MKIRRVITLAATSLSVLFAGCATRNGDVSFMPPFMPQQSSASLILGEHASIANDGVYNGWKLRPTTLMLGDPHQRATVSPPRLQLLNPIEFKLYGGDPKLQAECANSRTGSDYRQCQIPTPPRTAFFHHAGQIVGVPVECRVNPHPMIEPIPGQGAQVSYLSANCYPKPNAPYTVYNRNGSGTSYSAQ